eukprot:8219225-Heterocapsa_arctica.AAC.1
MRAPARAVSKIPASAAVGHVIADVLDQCLKEFPTFVKGVPNALLGTPMPVPDGHLIAESRRR